MDDHFRRLIARDDEMRKLTARFEEMERFVSKTQSLVDRLQPPSALQQYVADQERIAAQLRAAMGPINDLKRALANTRTPALDSLSALARSFEDRFRLPEISSLRTMMSSMEQSGALAALAATQSRMDAVRLSMESMRAPWLDIQRQLESMNGLAHLHGIGQAIHAYPAFDDRLALALRFDLGDYRDLVTWPEAIFSDPLARSDYYREHGLNPEITAFPAEAFWEASERSGLDEDDAGVPLFDTLWTPDTDTDREEGYRRTNRAHHHLLRFETEIRDFIAERMTAAAGPGWVKSRTPDKMLDRWKEKQAKAIAAGEPEAPLIAYADFSDYLPIIERGDNWNAVFKPVFGRVESVRESLQRLYPIRICTMHARLITQDDELYLLVEVKRIIKAIRTNR